MRRPKRTEANKTRSAPASGRALWSGQLRLALVSIPVQLVAALQGGSRLAFHQVDAKTHKRIRYEKVAPGAGKVAANDIVKGYELSKGQYVLLREEDFDRVRLEAKRAIDLVQFVDHCEIDPIYFDKPYYVLPDGAPGEEAYAVLRDALRATGKMGLGQFVMRGRDYVGALKPCGQGLMLETLRFADEVRDAAPFFADAPDEEADTELLDMARDLIAKRTKTFDAARFKDRYSDALRELIEAKARNVVPVAEEEAEPAERGNVIDLVEALRRSVQSGAEKPPAAKPRAKKPARRRKAG